MIIYTHTRLNKPTEVGHTRSPSFVVGQTLFIYYILWRYILLFIILYMLCLYGYFTISYDIYLYLFIFIYCVTLCIVYVTYMLPRWATRGLPASPSLDNSIYIPSTYNIIYSIAWAGSRGGPHEVSHASSYSPSFIIYNKTK